MLGIMIDIYTYIFTYININTIYMCIIILILITATIPVLFSWGNKLTAAKEASGNPFLW